MQQWGRDRKQQDRCAGLGQGGKRRYGMGPSGIERNWMGEDGTGRDVTGGGGENGFFFFRIDKMNNFHG